MGNSKWLYLILFLIFLLQFAYSTQTLSSYPPNHLCPYEQSLVLLHFKQNFSIDSSASSDCDYYGHSSQPKTKSWNRTTDCCKWNGVTCDGLTGHVIGLDLSCSQLKGIIPSNSTLFQLSHLEKLNLAYNNFSPSLISHEFTGFARLRNLNLSSSGYSGQIPSEFLRMSELVSLDLSLNSQRIKLERHVFEILLRNSTQLSELSLIDVNISSVFPMNLSSSFTYLDLSYTELHGQLPDTIFHLPNLQTLKLTGNYGLTGYLPKVNASNSSPLRWLDLSSTSLLGEVLDSIIYLKNLNYLQLERCNLFGPIPEALGNLTQITDLHLYANNFDGEIPSTLSNLEKLTSLDFSFNNLKGQVPNVFGKLKHLSSLSLSGNNLNGPFPSSFANLTQLHSLFLSSNSLAGPIPSNIVGLQNLKILRLANNSFNGTVSSWLFTLPSLLTVDLSYNRFVGQIDDFRSMSLRYIDLSSNYLHGPIPESISKLVNLTVVNLFGNNLTGVVELDMFSNLVRLQQLDLSYNSLSISSSKININATLPDLYSLRLSSCKIKDFPNLLRAMVNLESLDLSHNQINGQLPNWTGSMWMDSLSSLNLSHNFLASLDPYPWVNLQVLDLRSNLLQGPLLSSVCNLSSLVVLDLSKNSFTGAIPQCLGNFSHQISVLDLRMNNFQGTIPTTFAEGNSLRNLNLNGNQLQGKLPRSLANCTQLEVLDLGNNQINDTYPQWLGSLSELQILILRSNRFHGSISSTSKTKLSFNKLRILDISYNEFTGLLPPKYFSSFKAMIDVRENKTTGMYMNRPYSPAYYYTVTVAMKGMVIDLVKILNVFTTIDLSSNQFEGRIPNSIGNLNSLRVLNLSHNNLLGPIPSVLRNLSLLESLDLSSNQLAGEIPEQLTGLTFLAVLNLSHNHLVGRIPRGPQFNTFQSDSYYGNSGLCGFPLLENCGENDTSQPPLPRVSEQKDDSDFASGFTWKVVLMGYGCGTVFGLVIGSLMFFTGKPKWFTGIFEKAKHRNVRRPVKRVHMHFARN